MSPSPTPPLPPSVRDLLRPEVLLHSACGRPFADHPYGLPQVACPFPPRPPVEFATIPEEPSVSDRFYVSLTATCNAAALPAVLADMQAAQVQLASTDLDLDGLSLSYSRDGAEDYSAETVALPTPAPIVPDPVPPAGPVTSTGPGAPPPDAETGSHAAPEEQQS